MSWQAATAVHIGGRAEQQDRTAVLKSRFGKACLLVLGDGMGGHAQGAAAAQILIDTARKSFPPRRGRHPLEFLTSLCAQAHERIRTIARKEKEAHPGATCVLLHLRADEAHWLHVGDSRLYRYQGDRLLFCTEDHTIAALKADIPALATQAQEADPTDNRLYMCLGGGSRPEPAIGASAVSEDDWFLICSDGFWHGVEPHEVVVILKNGDCLSQAAQRLVELAVRRGGGTGDNVSVILVRHERRGSIGQRLRELFAINRQDDEKRNEYAQWRKIG